jgi:transcriptional regulator with PAS, ATPase and Fis domain
MATENKRRKFCLDDRHCCASILDTVQEPILILDKNYRIVDANEAVCNKFKCETEKIIGKYCYEIADNSNKPCFEKGMPCPVKIALETGHQARVIHEHPQPDNKIISEQILASPEKGDWEHIEKYIQEHSPSDLTHTICPECRKKIYPEY